MPAALPANYQYPLSAVIYKIIQQADAEFAAFLHDSGYGKGSRNFKLFTFSDIRTHFKMEGDRMLMLTDRAEVNVCFYLPVAAENFIKGLFLNQEIELGDRRSRVFFQVLQVQSVSENIPETDDSKVLLQPLSPIVTGIKNEKGNYAFLSPHDPAFANCLLINLLQKYKAIHNADDQQLEQLKNKIKIQPVLFSNPLQQRLITIKADTREETKIRGYKKFRLDVSAPKEMLEIALGAGLGLYNAQGMGCVEVAGK